MRDQTNNFTEPKEATLVKKVLVSEIAQLKSVINTIRESLSPADSGDLSSLLGGL